MLREPLLFVATSDIAGKVRGKAFPAARLGERAARGVGWTPTNVQITCFDAIAESPYGALGDLLLVPDPEARFEIDLGGRAPPRDFALGDILELDGTPWECCTRSILKSALARLERVAGVRLRAAFEHEFQLKGPARPRGDAYSMAGFEARRAFGEAVMGAIDAAGYQSDTFMREYGADQYEVTVAPEIGVRAADAAVVLRELVRAAALELGEDATFTPIRDPAGVGNGVHVHASFVDASGEPVTHDPGGPHGMSALTGAFVAGVLAHLESIVAFTAPSVISYARLTPHRWSAAFNNLGLRDREAAVRLCPVTERHAQSAARQYNFEYRAADAAASPYLALAAIVHAGAQGVEDGLPPPEVTAQDLSRLEPSALAARGLVRLPTSLAAALDRLEASPTARAWFPGRFCDIYVAHKRHEIALVEAMAESARYVAYEEVY
ncbi:MAG: glutamine synthetase [Ectothiorhodospiraceae bacterium]|nr:glutamine synthetase [Ectothiorhodospiraceae bacterium]